jgi:hypothetical protein
MAHDLVLCRNRHQNEPTAPNCETCGLPLGDEAVVSGMNVTDRRGGQVPSVVLHEPPSWLTVESALGEPHRPSSPWWIEYEIESWEEAVTAARGCYVTVAMGEPQSDDVSVLAPIVHEISEGVGLVMF